MSIDKGLNKIKINPALEATRVGSDFEESKPLSPRYFLPEDALKYKAVSSLDLIKQDAGIPRSVSFLNIETEKNFQERYYEAMDRYDKCLNACISENETLRAENERLKNDVPKLIEISASKDQIIMNLQIELKNYMTEISHLNSKISSLTVQVNTLKADNEVKDTRIKRKTEENEELSQEFKDTKMRHRKACDNYDSQVQDLNKEITAMRNELNSLRNLNNDHIEQIKEHRTQNCQLNQVISCLKNQNDTLANNERLLKQEKETLENRFADLLLENEKLAKLSVQKNTNLSRSIDHRGRMLVTSSSFEINEAGEEKVFWKKMIKTIKMSAKEKDIKKKIRLSGNLKTKK